MIRDEICKTPSVRRKADRPTEILAAAFEEFVVTGYAATRLEDVAARAGVTKGTIYFHFQNKENVFVQMVKELSEPMQAKTLEFLDSNTETGAQFFISYLDFAYAHHLEDRHAREILRLIIADASRFPTLVDEYFECFIQPVFARLLGALNEGVERGEVRKSPVLNFPEILLSPMLGLNIFRLIFADRRSVDSKKHLEAAKDLLLNGLLPR